MTYAVVSFLMIQKLEKYVSVGACRVRSELPHSLHTLSRGSRGIPLNLNSRTKDAYTYVTAKYSFTVTKLRTTLNLDAYSPLKKHQKALMLLSEVWGRWVPTPPLRNIHEVHTSREGNGILNFAGIHHF